MRCACCDCLLSDFEATRRHALTKDFVDLCGECIASIRQDTEFDTLDRPDLEASSDNWDMIDNDWD